jgi:putative acetyltransferase
VTAPITVRAEGPADLPAVHRLVANAFGGEQVAALLEALRESVAWLDLSFVAVQDTEVVGHVAFTRAWVDMPDRLLEVLVLSPLAVRPDRQRTGIGRTLVSRAVDLLRDRDEPLVFLEGDPGYYPRLGFVPGGDLGFTPPSVRIPRPAFQVATLPAYDETMSGALVYPDVFWRHDAVGLRPPPGAPT